MTGRSKGFHLQLLYELPGANGMSVCMRVCERERESERARERARERERERERDEQKNSRENKTLSRVTWVFEKGKGEKNPGEE